MTQTIENYTNSIGQEMVAVYEGETVSCYTKERWEEMQAQQVEHLTEIPTPPAE